MNRYFVVLISSTGERCVGNTGLSCEEAEGKRDRLNEDLAHQGVKYDECRYAMRILDMREMAVAA